MSASARVGEESETVRRIEALIVNPRGLHARASARFVRCVEAYDAEVTVEKDGHSVGGNSIMGLLTLGAVQGASISVSASGPEADDVLAALRELIAAGFGET